VEAALPADCAVFAAAVADWRVATPGREKIKKQKGKAPPPLALGREPGHSRDHRASQDAAPAPRRRLRGRDRERDPNAKDKLTRKGCDGSSPMTCSPETGIMGGESNTVHW
jgi:phosphopantothenoylcysteine decarboxylase/phosphopantothenate--cysteine ligase